MFSSSTLGALCFALALANATLLSNVIRKRATNTGVYDCNTFNPCTPGNAAQGKFYFPNTNPNKYVQCSAYGQCYLKVCPGKLVWDVTANTCNYAKVPASDTSDINECASDPCENGGSCSDQVNSYMCQCPSGFTGASCQTNINECASNPCENEGSCSDQVNSYMCQCPSGFTGASCETNINEGASDPCENGGSCSDQVNSYTCQCPFGFTGASCETIIGDLILRNTQKESWSSDFFQRSWAEYQQGFGTLDSRYWIGLDKLHDLSQRGCAVRFDFKSFADTCFYAEYSTFIVGGSADLYRLTVDGYDGNFGNAMLTQNNSQFSTYDRGPSASDCAAKYFGGWWYAGSSSCGAASLTVNNGDLFWYDIENYDYNLITDFAEVEVRFAC